MEFKTGDLVFMSKTQTGKHLGYGTNYYEGYLGRMARITSSGSQRIFVHVLEPFENMTQNFCCAADQVEKIYLTLENFLPK